MNTQTETATEEEIQTQRQPPLGAVMGMLAENTAQRDNAQANNAYLNGEIRTHISKHMELLGRLSKYENTIDEAMEYAVSKGLFLSCDSEKIGVLSTIKNYTNKKGKSHKAHFSVYGTYLEKCKKEGEPPKSYKGNFLYKTYKAQFDALRNERTTFDKFEDLFNL